jgi:uncharacterized membrane protein YphA (DoxX/SURF4 family)
MIMGKLFFLIIRSVWLTHLIRIVLAVIFLYAGASKLLQVKAFGRLISQYDLVPESFLPVTAVGLPMLEILAGIGLLLSLRGSLSLTLTLLMLFITILWYGILKDLKVDCGCFSMEELMTQEGLWQAFYRDLVMMVGVLFLYGVRWFQFNSEETLPLWTKIKRII